MRLIMNNAHLYQLAFKEMKTMELKNQYNYENDIHIENMGKTGSSSGSSSSNKKPSTIKSGSGSSMSSFRTRMKAIIKHMEERIDKMDKDEFQKLASQAEKQLEEKARKEAEEKARKEASSDIWVLSGLLKAWNKKTKDWYKEKDGEMEPLIYNKALSTYFLHESNNAHVQLKLEKDLASHGGFIMFKWESDEIIVNSGGYDTNEICLGGEGIKTLQVAANHLWIDFKRLFVDNQGWKAICVEQKLWNKQTKEQRQLFKEELVKLKTGTKMILIVKDDEHGIFGV